MSTTHVEFDGRSFAIPAGFEQDQRRLLLDAAKIVEDAMDRDDYTDEKIEVELGIMPDEIAVELIRIVQECDPAAKATSWESDEHGKEGVIVFSVEPKPETD